MFIQRLCQKLGLKFFSFLKKQLDDDDTQWSVGADMLKIFQNITNSL